VHELLARADGTALARATVHVPESADRFEAPPLVLPPGKVIRGRVLDAQDKPLALIWVKAFAERGESTVVFSAGKVIQLGTEDVLTGDDGTFELRGVEDLPYTVHPENDPRRPGLRSQPPEIKGVVAGGRILEFRLVPEALARGIVLDALTGLPITWFFVIDTEVRSADGRFEVPIWKDQEFQVEAPGHFPKADPGTGSTGRSGDRVVRLSPDPDTATLVVVAKDEAGEPVPAFRVSWFSGLRVLYAQAAPDGSGSLRIPMVPCSDTRLSVDAEGRTPAVFRVELGRGAEKSVEVRLVTSSPVRLRLLLPNGNTAKLVRAAIEDERGERLLWKFTFLRPQGKWLPVQERSSRPGPDRAIVLDEADGLIGGLPPGRYRLVLGGAGDSVTPFTVSPGRIEELTVQMKD
jgi:hypothetical protein